MAVVLAHEGGVSWVLLASSSEVEYSPESDEAASCLVGKLFGGVHSLCSDKAGSCPGGLFCGGSSPSSNDSEFDAGSSPDASGVFASV